MPLVRVRAHGVQTEPRPFRYQGVGQRPESLRTTTILNISHYSHISLLTRPN